MEYKKPIQGVITNWHKEGFEDKYVIVGTAHLHRNTEWMNEKIHTSKVVGIWIMNQVCKLVETKNSMYILVGEENETIN